MPQQICLSLFNNQGFSLNREAATALFGTLLSAGVSNFLCERMKASRTSRRHFRA